MITNRSKKLFAAVCLSAGIAFAPHAIAQSAAPQPQPAPPAAETMEVSDDQLQSFAVAFVEVERLKQEYIQRLQEAASETEQQELQAEAGEKMLQAVEQTEGISANEYNQIIQSAQNDPELAQRLTDAIGEASAPAQ